MKKTIVPNSDATQEKISKKRIPKHRRLIFEIEANEPRYKKINTKKDQSERLFFIPFAYRRKTTNGQEVRSIKRMMKTSSKIATRFKFDLDLNRDLNNKIFSQLSQEVKKAQGLRVFDFYIWGASEIDDLALRNLGIGLKPLKRLRYLKIRMVECCYMNNQGVADIGKALRRLVSLETLDLSFDEGGQVDDEGVRALWQSLRYLKALKTLKISFHYCGGIAYGKMGNVERVFQGLKSLKEIKINCFLMEQMSFEGIQNISSMLKVLTGLEMIDLRLTECNLDDGWLKELMKGFEGKTELKKIILDIGRNNYLTNKELENLKECFKGLKQIEEIKIDLQGCKRVTEEGAQMLREGLQGISSLKHLKVKLKREEN